MNYNIFLIKLLLLSNFNLLSAAISPNHQLVLAAAGAGDLPALKRFCINPNQTTEENSALSVALKYNRRNTAEWLLENGAQVGGHEIIRAAKTGNRRLMLLVLSYIDHLLRLPRSAKEALTDAALKAGDPVILTLLAQRNLIHLDKKQPQKKVAASLETAPVESNAENLECAICLEPLSIKTGPQKFFRCDHGSNHFHLNCIKKSIKQTNKKCPLCRSGLKV
jgi:hypothetical protein